MTERITLGSNIASLRAQRNLNRATDEVESVFARLSSGQRINSASDDAAGLAIADTLKSKRRIFTQGVRNFNDGLSLLSIADSAIEQLSNITTKLMELATQSANGSVSAAQRAALDEEAQALSDEFTRITQTTTFNGRNLFDSSFGSLSLQGSIGNDGSITSGLGGAIGTGQLNSATSLSMVSGNGRDVATGDLNGDGTIDFVAVGSTATGTVMLGNGDGTFRAGGSLNTSVARTDVVLGDMNSDGILDVISASGATVSINLGNGVGGFGAATTFSAGLSVAELEVGDINGDGALDVVVAGSETIQVETSNSGPPYYTPYYSYYQAASVKSLLGNGSGSLSGASLIRQSSSTASYYYTTIALELNDVNSDGNLDIIMGENRRNSTGGSGGYLITMLGDGSSGFTETDNDILLGWRSITSIEIGDINGDGKKDVVATAAQYYNYTLSSLGVIAFNGANNGTFSESLSLSTSGSTSADSDLVLGDINSDGNLDIVSTENDNINIRLGNGNGTFAANSSTTNSAWRLADADINGDGVIDILSVNNTGSIKALTSRTTDGVAPLLEFSLQSAQEAKEALTMFRNKLNILSSQRGKIGAFQSRLGVGQNVLQVTAENFAAAESRIRDTDVADDSSKLVRLSILQNSSTAILSQANLQPSLVLTLLNGG
jgi:flagellin